MFALLLFVEIKSTELKEWSEAKIILEKALKDKERFSDLVLKVAKQLVIV